MRRCERLACPGCRASPPHRIACALSPPGGCICKFFPAEQAGGVAGIEGAVWPVPADEILPDRRRRPEQSRRLSRPAAGHLRRRLLAGPGRCGRQGRLGAGDALAKEARERVEGAARRRAQAASASTTSSAIASELVSPGLSMPSRLTSPGTPWIAGPSIRKSGIGSLGRMQLRPDAGIVGDQRTVRQGRPIGPDRGIEFVGAGRDRRPGPGHPPPIPHPGRT